MWSDIKQRKKEVVDKLRNDLEFYIPQLCTLSANKIYSEPIKNYLLQMQYDYPRVDHMYYNEQYNYYLFSLEKNIIFLRNIKLILYIIIC